MIRTLRRYIATDGNDNKEYIYIACLSTDTKPTTGIITGSAAIEVDTGKRYEFNEVAGEWVEQPASGGGSGLPPVTAADNGKVLGVEDGEWGPVEAPSGGGVLYIDLVNRGGLNVNDEVTYQEVYDAYASGRVVIARSSGAVMYYLQYILKSGNNFYLSFVGTGNSNTKGEVWRLTANSVSADSTIALTTYTDAFDAVVELTGTSTLTPTSQMTVQDVKDAWIFNIHNGNFMAGETMDYCDVAYRSNGAMFSSYEIVIKSRYTGKMYTTGSVSGSTALSFTEIQ